MHVYLLVGCVARKPTQRHISRERLVSVSSTGNNCWAYCLQLASGTKGSISHREANRIRSDLGFPVGKRLNMLQVLKVVRDTYNWSGLVTVGANPDLPNYYNKWPADLKAGKVVILRIKNSHCSLFQDHQSCLDLCEAKQWLVSKHYTSAVDAARMETAGEDDSAGPQRQNSDPQSRGSATVLDSTQSSSAGENETQDKADAGPSGSIYLCVLHGTEVSGLETSWHRSFRA